MKKFLLSLAFIVLALNVSLAQEWQTDFGKAKALATKENKPIILVFQGSDWCAPCIKLDKEIWQSAEFKSYAEKHFIMLKADFPRKAKNALSAAQQEANNKLAETYNQNGYFPLVVVLDEKGTVLGRAGYEKTDPKVYISRLNAFVK